MARALSEYDLSDWYQRDKRRAAGRWFPWTGFCVFSFTRVAPLPLDFGLDWLRGLDTGGADRDPLYRHVQPRSLPDREIREVAALPGTPLRDAYFEWRDDWIHEVGMAGLPALRPAKRRALERILAPRLAG